MPSAAADTYDDAPKTSWSYTDSRDVHSSLGSDADEDFPVGAWRDDDGKHHLSKGYFTFNLAEYRDKRILSARVIARETAATDCDKPRSTELWVVDAGEAPTWADQPSELQKIDGGFSYSCEARLGWVTTDIVREAVQSGEDSVSFALRIADQFQGDVAYGRRYASDVRLSVEYNEPPNAPTDLTFDRQACDDTAPWNTNPNPALRAYVSDPEGDAVRATFAIWPVDDPSDRTVHTSSWGSGGHLYTWRPQDGVLEHDREYAWQVRAEDDHDVSAWSAECRLRNDFDAPDSPPTVSSVDYPDDGQAHFGSGQPGEFTFDADGDQDVVGFNYYSMWDSSLTYVAADEPGGTATVTITPESGGRAIIYAESVDRAGNRSARASYDFLVEKTEPIVQGPYSGRAYVPVEFTFSPRMENVVSYTYRVDGGDPVTVTAEDDGTAGFTMTPESRGTIELDIWSTSADGIQSATTEHSVQVTDAPLVSSDEYGESWPGSGGAGVEGTFHFKSELPDLVEFEYYFDGESPQVVTANDDGTAEITYTPKDSGFDSVTVAGRTADGHVTEEANYTFYVADPDGW